MVTVLCNGIFPAYLGIYLELAPAFYTDQSAVLYYVVNHLCRVLFWVEVDGPVYECDTSSSLDIARISKLASVLLSPSANNSVRTVF